jgi:hypothetical protein
MIELPITIAIVALAGLLAQYRAQRHALSMTVPEAATKALHERMDALAEELDAMSEKAADAKATAAAIGELRDQLTAVSASTNGPAGRKFPLAL